MSELQETAYPGRRRQRRVSPKPISAVSETTTKLAPSALWKSLLLSGFFLLSNNRCSCFVPLSKRHGTVHNPTYFPDTLASSNRCRPKTELLSSQSAPNSNSSSVYEIFLEEDTKTRLKDDDGRSDEIVEEITDYFANKEEGSNDETIESRSKRGNIQLVAGSGKTFVAWRVMENLLVHQSAESDGRAGRRKRTQKPRIGVYVTPYLNLVDQALNNKDEHEIMVSTNGKGSHLVDVDTMIIASRSSRKQEKVSTDSDDIVEFLQDDTDSRRKSQVKIFVCTYNSLPRLGEALRNLYPGTNPGGTEDDSGSVDFAVFDEAHKMEGVGGSRTSKTCFSYGLYDSNIVIENRLFMSGTPNNYTQTTTIIEGLPTRPRQDGARMFIRTKNATSDESGEKTKQRKKRTIRSFSDESLFGPCLARKSHLESVEQNVTLPISLFGVETDVFREHNSNDQIPDGAEKDYYLPLAIRSAFQKLNVKHAVSFHSTNQRARDFMEMSRKVFRSSNASDPIALFNVNCDMSPSERRGVLDKAGMAPRSLITNCKLLSLGVDEASLDLVVIADPVFSSVNGRQMIGRVGRKAPGKERGYVLVPIPLSTEDGARINQEGHVYNVFVNTFNHMVSLDPELRRDVLFVVQKGMELGRSLDRSEYPARLLEAFVFPEKMPIKLQRQLMNSAIVAYTNNHFSVHWNHMFGLLVQYKEREGHCNVPRGHEEDGKKLGSWVRTQRVMKKKGRLDKALEERLIKVGFVWDPFAQQWNDMYALLVQYKEREGHSLVPRGHEEDGKNLGSWVQTQRAVKKKGKLDKALEERLIKVGFVWDLLAEQWNDMYALLVQYKEREGHCNVPRGHEEDGKKLGTWVQNQRAMKKKGGLDKALEERLIKVGFVWDLLAEQWNHMFGLLVQYKEREGHCIVPRGHEDGKKLGTWVQTQRTMKKKGRLDKALEERLMKVGFVWDLLAEQWNDMFALLVQYKEREGHCNVPRGHEEDGKNLGKWVQNQRQFKIKGKLDKALEERLIKVGFVWDRFAQQWNDMYALLVQYKEREGHCNVPRGHEEDGKKLGSWVQTQRAMKKKGRLDKALEEKLIKVGFVWDPFAQQWNDMYALLVQYKEREGHSLVPRGHEEDGKKLGTWVRTQRAVKKKGKLDKALEERLIKVGFVWDPFAQQWNDMYALLVQYKEREGHCNVPLGHEEDGKKLGKWVGYQRVMKKKGKLDKALEERLIKVVGFVWDLLAQQWNDMYALLVQYKEREGHCNVPSGHEEDGKKLATWVQTQRTMKKKGRLDKALEERLMKVGFVWDLLAEQWNDMYALLVQYKEREGHCIVPRGHEEDGKKLATWVQNQRAMKKKGGLDKALEERLIKVGFVWDLLAEQWNDMYALLVQYKEREGHCLVPVGHEEDGKNLGSWVQTQRAMKKKGRLDKALEERLIKVGFVWAVKDP